MSEELDELDRAIDRCRTTIIHIPDAEDAPGLLQDFHVLCEECRHIESIHHKVHKLRSRGQLMMGLFMAEIEKREPQARQLKREIASVFDVEPFAPFDLHGVTPWKGLPQDRLAKGQELALDVGEGVVEFAQSVREDLGGPSLFTWPHLLNELTRLADRALLDYIKPDWKEPKFSEELIARDVLSMVEKDQESHGSTKIGDYLRDMDPPFTWGEVVYHVLRDPETRKGERGEALSEFLSLFKKRYCLECDELFTGPKSSPRLTCDRCGYRLRKRKERHGRPKQRDTEKVSV